MIDNNAMQRCTAGRAKHRDVRRSFRAVHMRQARRVSARSIDRRQREPRIAWLSTRVATGTGARAEAPRMRSDRTSETGVALRAHRLVALAATSITLQRYNFLIYQQFLHAFTDIIIFHIKHVPIVKYNLL